PRGKRPSGSPARSESGRVPRDDRRREDRAMGGGFRAMNTRLHGPARSPVRIIALAGAAIAALAAAAIAQEPSRPAGPPPMPRFFPRHHLLVSPAFAPL